MVVAAALAMYGRAMAPAAKNPAVPRSTDRLVILPIRVSSQLWRPHRKRVLLFLWRDYSAAGTTAPRLGDTARWSRRRGQNKASPGPVRGRLDQDAGLRGRAAR